MLPRSNAKLAFTFALVVSFMAQGGVTVRKKGEAKGVGGVTIRDSQGRRVSLYKGSYALVIGVSDYTAGWPDLPNVPHELQPVGSALSQQGFHVRKVMNPDAAELHAAFKSFIDTYGYQEGNRLLFFFSGHGHSRRGGRKGYLVPTDAPDPRKDDTGFLRKALPMSQILAWCRQMEAKHALFLFDSCFSGTIFRTKALPKTPPHISDLTSRPVRQFITAGDSGEEVPAKSVFTPCFVRALRGEADLSRDGYVTGAELGMYLHDKVLYYRTGQTPQYGKIREPDLDEGDFVFALGETTKPVKVGKVPDMSAWEKQQAEFARRKVAAEAQKKLADSKRFWQEGPPRERPSGSSSAALAQRILSATGVTGGLIVHLGCGDGKLTAALCASRSYFVYGLDSDAANIRKAATHIQSSGVANKVSVKHWTGSQLPYADNFVNLLVSEELGGVSMQEVMRVLAPLGVAYIKRGGKWIKTVKPGPQTGHPVRPRTQR